MRRSVSERLLAVVDDIDSQGSANLARLTVLKKWFERPGRMATFGLWMAKRVADEEIKATGEAKDLLVEARLLLNTAATRNDLPHDVDRAAAAHLHDRARDFQYEFEDHQWGLVRIIHCWPLVLVEQGLALYTGKARTPTEGYKLAADFCQHYAPRYGNCLNGPSRDRVMEIVKFVNACEADENAETP